MNKLLRLNLDFAGMSASLICAIHCIIGPIAISFGMANSSNISHNHSFDAFIISFGVFVAGFSLIKDVFKHKNLLPVFFALFGFLLLGYSVLSESINHLSLSLLGGFFVSIAHYYNWRLSHN